MPHAASVAHREAGLNVKTGSANAEAAQLAATDAVRNERLNWVPLIRLSSFMMFLGD